MPANDNARQRRHVSDRRCRKGAGWEVRRRGDAQPAVDFLPRKFDHPLSKSSGGGCCPSVVRLRVTRGMPSFTDCHMEGWQSQGWESGEGEGEVFWEKGSQSFPTGLPFRTAMYPANTQKSDKITPQRTAHRLNEMNSIFCPIKTPFFMFFRKYRSS